ncbi:hypothetical protein MRB53_011378 [Persea americana]|uniref:Uncharacterized protein n=1 Tax=Persea americana TaxID=3435 RepID=A0ACC2LUU3_PERAE|nr:hypothetical protein MRB53_011378 [Persea americana]|eukprot:TRINITY_DN33165_c0_g3_i1.p1 TRINITY_DN33165_c0_g3~~TRINITY_DN33165_c0_g3_i1.p1  ORF type:complete len:445 (+),score=117.37 TRINITY_DN33165_c0_g3_i1:792-2126(+)
MKLESETGSLHPSLTYVPPKTVIYDYKPVETNENGREGKHEITSVLESKNYEKADPIPAEKCVEDGWGYEPAPGKCDSNNGRVNECEKVTASCFAPLPENETALYADKTVTDEMPELMSCFKENAIKDICIDKGVPALDKILVGNVEVDHKRYFGILQSELDEYSDLTKGTEVNPLPICDDLKTSVFDGQLIPSEEKEVANGCIHESLQVERGGNDDASDGVVNNAPDEVIPETLGLVQDSNVGNQHADSSSSDRCEDQENADQKHAWDATDSADVRSSCGADEANMGTSMECSIHEAYNQSRDDINLPFDSKAKSGSTTFDSSSQSTSIRAESAENADCQQSGQSITASVLEDDPLDSLTGSTRSFFIQHGVGESSFSGMGAVSGPLGSISFRSDSSTTSTRSFAFPILNSEWNSSPVKMAKADRRHFRKHRGWKMALLCCRF